MTNRAREGGFFRTLKWSGGDPTRFSDLGSELPDFLRQTQELSGAFERVVGMLMVPIELHRFDIGRSLRSLGTGENGGRRRSTPRGRGASQWRAEGCT